MLLFLLPLALVPVVEASSVPVYGRFQTCVTSDAFKYHNPFNYTEVCVHISVPAVDYFVGTIQVNVQGSFTGPDGNVTVDG